jgi:hypothetical protein
MFLLVFMQKMCATCAFPNNILFVSIQPLSGGWVEVESILLWNQNPSVKKYGCPSTTSTFGEGWTQCSSPGVVRIPCLTRHAAAFAIRNGDTSTRNNGKSITDWAYRKYFLTNKT